MRRMLVFMSGVALAVVVQAGGNEDVRHRGDVKYRVVINHEEQYSIWFADREIPAGWKDAEFVGTKKEALDHIEEVWTDMRPLSRRHIAEDNHKKLSKKPQG